MDEQAVVQIKGGQALMTEQQLQEIREFENNASPGPWVGEYRPSCGRCIFDADGRIVFSTNSGVGHHASGPNIEFATKARTYIPALLGEVARLKAALKEREAALQTNDLLDDFAHDRWPRIPHE